MPFTCLPNTMRWYRHPLKRLKTHIQCFLTRYLPRRIKRLIYLASIAGLILEQRSDRALADSINRILELAKDPKALEFPMAVRYFIWKDLISTTVVRSEKRTPSDASLLSLASIHGLDEFIALFHDNAPSYLLYDTPDRVKEDLTLLFSSVVPSFSATANS